MCGIVGYVGRAHATPILLDGLRRLEYRGYDSAGLAVVDGGQLDTRKCAGRIAALAKLVKKQPVSGSLGISHTRWATHGKVNDENAHPHFDASGKLALVHNGVIENYQALKDELIRSGDTKFRSDTDTEVLAHLIGKLYDDSCASTVDAPGKKARLFRGCSHSASASDRHVRHRSGSRRRAGFHDRRAPWKSARARSRKR